MTKIALLCVPENYMKDNERYFMYNNLPQQGFSAHTNLIFITNFFYFYAKKMSFSSKNNTFCHIFSSEFEYPWTYPFTHKINFLWKQFSQASNIFQISHDVFQLFQSREICCYVWSITHGFIDFKFLIYPS